ncbi:hypothetical protein FB567DRAFT_529951 [Paraphoma chrysanthemicola]|uniref:R3H domain-containing protein n=1 Tax=Paraphoma chrysanthemicola TaxID=798071 RepID=A0A8K0R2Y4_9PLEO|nr:hypothetical protein FB567DRAFT_529951 [Paraphoma chrysanthemicola]
MSLAQRLPPHTQSRNPTFASTTTISTSRHPPTMPSLLTLPPELRRLILSYILPETHSLPFPIHPTPPSPFPHAIRNILHTNHLLRVDTAHLIGTWSPMWMIPSPVYLTTANPALNGNGSQVEQSNLATWLPSLTISGVRKTPKLERICLDIWHESDRNRITWTCFCVGEDRWTHHDLVSSWASSISYLPTSTSTSTSAASNTGVLAGVKEVYLDITPAPAGIRRGHRIAMYPLLHDKRVQTFLSYHLHDVADLVRSISTYYSSKVKVKVNLTGTLSTKSIFYPDAIVNTLFASDVWCEWVGSYIPTQVGRFHKLSTSVNRLVHTRDVGQAKKRGEVHPWKKLEGVEWARDTGWQWGVVADLDGDGDEGGVERCVDDLKRVAEFAWGKEEVGVGEMDMGKAGNVRRKLQHLLARDIGLTTQSVGEGEGRRVIVRREA